MFYVILTVSYAGANNRKVIITYRFLAAPVQAKRDFFYIDCMTVYFNCKYFPEYTRELLECLLGFHLPGEIPAGAITQSTGMATQLQLELISGYFGGPPASCEAKTTKDPMKMKTESGKCFCILVV